MGVSATLFAWVGACIRKYGWVPFLFFAVHLAVSKGLDAYLHLPWLDIPMHFFGGVAIAFFYWKSLLHPLAASVLGELSSFGRQILGVAAVGATTAVWEFAEWFTDYLGITEAQVGLDDTILDMLLGFLGGILYLVMGPQASKTDV